MVVNLSIFNFQYQIGFTTWVYLQMSPAGKIVIFKKICGKRLKIVLVVDFFFKFRFFGGAS